MKMLSAVIGACNEEAQIRDTINRIGSGMNVKLRTSAGRVITTLPLA
jgi:hypothetical protein